MSTPFHAPFVVLRAQDRQRGESLNAGVVLLAPEGPLVGLHADVRRLRAVNPDFAAVPLDGWAADVQTALAEHAQKLDSSQLIALLPLLVQPFVADTEPGITEIGDAGAAAEVERLLTWLVRPRAPTLRRERVRAKKASRLTVELRAWLRHAKAFSTKVEDLRRQRVVSNYPIDPQSELYADFALLNGQLHVMEVMDLRGVDRLSSAIRGEAALKGVTLDEARDKANPIGVIAASDYGVAKPAIHMINRYAADVYDLGSPGERARFAAFVAKSLHRQELEFSAPI